MLFLLITSLTHTFTFNSLSSLVLTLQFRKKTRARLRAQIMQANYPHTRTRACLCVWLCFYSPHVSSHHETCFASVCVLVLLFSPHERSARDRRTDRGKNDGTRRRKTTHIHTVRRSLVDWVCERASTSTKRGARGSRLWGCVCVRERENYVGESGEREKLWWKLSAWAFMLAWAIFEL